MMNWTTSLDDRWKVELDLNSFASLLCALPIRVAGNRKKLIVSEVEGGVGRNPALINSTVRLNGATARDEKRKWQRKEHREDRVSNNVEGESISMAHEMF